MPFKILDANRISIVDEIKHKLLNNRILEFVDGKLTRIEGCGKDGRIYRSFGHNLKEAIERFNSLFSKT